MKWRNSATGFNSEPPNWGPGTGYQMSSAFVLSVSLHPLDVRAFKWKSFHRLVRGVCNNIWWPPLLQLGAGIWSRTGRLFTLIKLGWALSPSGMPIDNIEYFRTSIRAEVRRYLYQMSLRSLAIHPTYFSFRVSSVSPKRAQPTRSQSDLFARDWGRRYYS